MRALLTVLLVSSVPAFADYDAYQQQIESQRLESQRLESQRLERQRLDSMRERDLASRQQQIEADRLFDAQQNRLKPTPFVPVLVFPSASAAPRCGVLKLPAMQIAKDERTGIFTLPDGAKALSAAYLFGKRGELGKLEVGARQPKGNSMPSRFRHGELEMRMVLFDARKVPHFFTATAGEVTFTKLMGNAEMGGVSFEVKDLVFTEHTSGTGCLQDAKFTFRTTWSKR